MEFLNFKRWPLLSLIPITMLMGVICLWQGNQNDFLMRGARGLLEPSIGWPIFIFMLIYTATLCINKNYTIEFLCFGSGVFFAIGIALALYVENGGMLIFLVLSNILGVGAIRLRN